MDHPGNLRISRDGVRRVFATVAVLAAGCGMAVQRFTASPQTDRSSESLDQTVDLGEVAVDADPKHVFHLVNTDDHSIEVLRVNSSCGCEKADVQVGRTILPGESLAIPYSLARRGGGMRRGTLTIETSATSPSLRQVSFSLTGIVPRKVWSEPESIEFCTADSSLTPEPVRLAVYARDPLMLRSGCRFTTSRELVTIEPVPDESFTDGTGHAGGWAHHYFLLRLRPDPPVGMTMDYVTVQFSDSAETRLSIPVISRIVPSSSVLVTESNEMRRSTDSAREGLSLRQR